MENIPLKLSVKISPWSFNIPLFWGLSMYCNSNRVSNRHFQKVWRDMPKITPVGVKEKLSLNRGPRRKTWTVFWVPKTVNRKRRSRGESAHRSSRPVVGRSLSCAVLEDMHQCHQKKNAGQRKSYFVSTRQKWRDQRIPHWMPLLGALLAARRSQQVSTVGFPMCEKETDVRKDSFGPR